MGLLLHFNGRGLNRPSPKLTGSSSLSFIVFTVEVAIESWRQAPVPKSCLTWSGFALKIDTMAVNIPRGGAASAPSLPT